MAATKLLKSWMTLAASARSRSFSAMRSAGWGASMRVVIVPRREVQIGDEREHDPERRPGARHTPEIDAAAVLLHDLVRDGQPEPGARGLRGEERVEDAVGRRGRNPRSAVLDLDLHATVEATPRARGRIAALAPAQAEREPAALRHGLQRVGQQIDERPVERLLVGLDGRHVAGEL